MNATRATVRLIDVVSLSGPNGEDIELNATFFFYVDFVAGQCFLFTWRCPFFFLSIIEKMIAVCTKHFNIVKLYTSILAHFVNTKKE